MHKHLLALCALLALAGCASGPSVPSNARLISYLGDGVRPTAAFPALDQPGTYYIYDNTARKTLAVFYSKNGTFNVENVPPTHSLSVYFVADAAPTTAPAKL